MSIGKEAFRGCSGLTSITIPNSVTSIGSYAFDGCASLTSLTYHCKSIIGDWFGFDYSCKKNITQVRIGEEVEEIGDQAFSYCSGLTSIEIPNSVTSIGDRAFSGCSGLTSIEIPNSVTSIGDDAFSGCSGLTSIEIPNSVTSIGNSAFSGCSGLTSVHISDIMAWCNIQFESNPLSYAHHLFLNGKEIKDLVIPNSVTSIDRAFSGCTGLTSITIPNSVTSMNGAFSGCTGLTSITIPNSVTSMDGAFSGCSGLTSIIISNGVTAISGSVFSGCTGFTSITIPNSVTFIGNSAFSECRSLTSVMIGSGVQGIDSRVFSYCKELTDVYSYAEAVPSTNSNAFDGSYIEYSTLHVPAASIDAYKSTAPWSQFKTIVAIDGDTPEEPETLKCATPTVAFKDGKLVFDCETENVEYVSEVTVSDNKMNYSNEVSLTGIYKVSVYATKAGYENSETVTKEIDVRGLMGDMNEDGSLSVTDVTILIDKILQQK